MRAAKPGIYNAQNGRHGSTGGTNYPSVLESYNRDSDYKRWMEGKRYFQGTGSSWGDVEVSYLVRTFRDFGSLPCGQLNTFTLFPSESSPEGAWTVVNRRRGAVILPDAINPQDVSIDQSIADPNQHRLRLDVSARLTSSQLAEWQTLVGDQFEDSATVTAAGVRLIDNPDGVVALTLVDVDLASMALVFDVTRPFVRARVDPSFDRGYWKQARYRFDAPLRWRADGTRLLCSSYRFHCVVRTSRVPARLTPSVGAPAVRSYSPGRQRGARPLASGKNRHSATDGAGATCRAELIDGANASTSMRCAGGVVTRFMSQAITRLAIASDSSWATPARPLATPPCLATRAAVKFNWTKQ